MIELAELGLRLDANGFVRSARTASMALDDIGQTSTKVQRKLEHFATAGGFALGSLAATGARDLGSVLHALSGLGFAFGPIVGAITLGVSSIASAFSSMSRETREESKKMADALIADARRLQDFSEGALRVRLAALEAQRSEIFGAINAQGKPAIISRGGGSFDFDPMALFGGGGTVGKDEQGRLNGLDASIRETKHALDAIGDTKAKEAAKKIADDLERARTAARDLSEEIGKRFDENIDKQIKTAQAAAKASEDDDKQRFTEEFERQQKLADQAIQNSEDIQAANERTHEENMRALDEEDARLARRNSILAGAGAGIIGGALAGRGGFAGALGGAASGAIGGIAGGTLGIVAGGVEGLVSGLLNLGNAAAAAREQFRQWKIQFEAFSDSLSLQLGDISQSEASIREFKRQVEEQRRAIIETHTTFNAVDKAKAAADHKPYLGTLSEEGQRLLDDLNEKERRRIEQLKKEADEIDRINAAVRNAPSGFYVEKYLRRIGAGGGLSSGWEGTGPTVGTLNPTTSTKPPTTFNLTLAPGSISIDGNLAPVAMAKKLVQGLQTIASTTGGTGMTLAAAMETV